MKRKQDSRKSDISKLSEAMTDMMKDYHLEGKYLESKLIGSWDKVMGKAIASRTEKLYIKDRVLYVYLISAPLRQELSLSRARVLQLLEEETGAKVIDDIVFR